jgi:hypothetical protein
MAALDMASQLCPRLRQLRITCYERKRNHICIPDADMQKRFLAIMEACPPTPELVDVDSEAGALACVGCAYLVATAKSAAATAASSASAPGAAADATPDATYR